MAVSVYQQGGYGTAPLFPNPIVARRDPASTDRVSPSGLSYPIFQLWNNELTDNNFIYLGGGIWVSFASVVGSVSQISGNTGVAVPTAGNINIVGTGTLSFAGSGSTLTGTITPGTGLISTLTGDSGGARSPTTGNMNLLGTANQVTVTGAASTLTWTIPATFIAPGSIAATSTLTATLGAITATNGNLVLATAGNKIQIATGANASVGTATLANGTVTVNTTAVTASSIILLTRQTVGTTGANDLGILSVGTVVAGTSFVINAWTVTDATTLQADDQSVIGWVIIN